MTATGPFGGLLRVMGPLAVTPDQDETARVVQRFGARRTRRTAVAALLVLLAGGSAWVDAGVTREPARAAGMLPAGVYPLIVFDTGESTTYRSSGDPAPSLTVSHEKGRQRLVYRLRPGEIALELLPGDATPSRTRLTMLTLLGVSFVADPPVTWRPMDADGAVVPGRPWSWTLPSRDGAVTLAYSAVARAPEEERVGGVAVTVQRVEATLAFSGAASGTLELRQWEEVGNPRRARHQLTGTVTVFGVATRLNTTVVVGGLGGLPVA